MQLSAKILCNSLSLVPVACARKTWSTALGGSFKGFSGYRLMKDLAGMSGTPAGEGFPGPFMYSLQQRIAYFAPWGEGGQS